MRVQLLLLSIFTIVLCCCFPAFAQESAQTPLSNFAGVWKIDFEKSYSRSERKKVSNYDAKIVVTDDTLRIYWDYTIDGGHSHFSETLVADGKEKELQKINEWDARSQTISFKDREIKRHLNYRITSQTVGVYLDEQLFSLSADSKTLIIESIFRSARRFDQANSENKKLVFNRVE